MNHRLCLSLVVALALFACTPLHAQHAGGHFGGGSGGGGFSGHSVGHAVSHSFGHMFGHRSGGHDSRMGKTPGSRGDEPSMAGAAFLHGKVVQLPGPAGATAMIRTPPHPAPAGFIPALVPHPMVPPRRQFGSGFCGSFGFSWHNFLFPGDFDCFGDPFLLDPFFSGGFIAGHFRSDSFVTAGDLSAQSTPMDSSPAADNGGATSLRGSPSSPPDREFSPTAAVPEDAPFTLLQLRDGSMYGLTRYWVEGDRLYYVTNYGGENSVPLDRVDIVETTKLNAGRGAPVVLPSAAPPQ
jgi:hypothetical protein